MLAGEDIQKSHLNPDAFLRIMHLLVGEAPVSGAHCLFHSASHLLFRGLKRNRSK